MKTRNLMLALLAITVGAAALSAQGFWEKKEWQKWSKEECRKMLEDSPWAQKWYRTHVAEDRFGQPTQGDTRETEQQIFYIIQLRSALPIRQAFIRDAQIRNKYDKMSAEQQKEFDASAGPFLARTYDDVIVVHVLYGSNIQKDERELMRFWQTFYPEGTVPMEAYLTAGGKRVPAIKYVTAKGGSLEFELIFPRVVDGVPIIDPNLKMISVEFQHPNIGLEGGARVYQDFKLEKMAVKGTVLY
ncbi:MAG: hypothetical protein M1453_06840 [Acidobacteria bacterium]|nr:hypothetical protein [Acidobacteriota bacterium]